MSKRIVILQGHPDTGGTHLCHALAAAYRAGAEAAGHTVTMVDVAALEFPYLASKEDWEKGPTPPALLPAQAALLAADHVVIFFPLWLGSLPARLKGFFEQVFRPSMMPDGQDMKAWAKLMKGTSARTVVTMGMPAFVYSLFFRAHGTKFFERGVLAFSGCGPVRHTYVGMVDAMTETKFKRWASRMERLGAKAK